MAIIWSTELATGFRTVDLEHQEIFERINHLLSACAQGKGRQEVIPLLSFLENYVRRHFANEERSMRSLAHPEYQEHALQHRELMDGVSRIKKLVDAEGVGVHTVVQLNSLVVHSFVTHIRKTDVRLSGHAPARMQA